MTLCISHEGQVIPVAEAELVRGSKGRSTDRKKGLLLSDVSFFGRKNMAKL
jgi:hypothetical protein